MIEVGAASFGKTRLLPTARQTPLVLDEMFFPGKPVSHNGEFATIDSAIDATLFCEAIRRVVAETETLRIRLRLEDDNLCQEIEDLSNYSVEQLDFSREAEPEAAARQWIDERYWKALNWNAFPLFDFALIKIRDDRHIWLCKYNHAIIDASGRRNLIERVGEVYRALAHNAEPGPSAAMSMAAIVEAEQTYLRSTNYEADLAYWKKRFESVPDPLVPLDRRNTERGKSGRPSRLQTLIKPEDFRRLHQLAGSLNTSAMRLCLAFTYTVFARLYGTQDILLGISQHGRTTDELKRAISLVMQTMPFRVNAGLKTSLADAVREIDATLLEDRAHSAFPFVSLPKVLGQGGSGRALADIVVNYFPVERPVRVNGITIARTNISRGFFTPWMISIEEMEDSGARLTIDYDPGLIAAEEAMRVSRCLHVLLSSGVADAALPIGQLPILSAEERNRLVVDVNRTYAPVPQHATLASLCAEQASRTPNAIAAICGSQSITYQTLHERAGMLAFELAELGVGPDVVVGLALPRTIDLLVAVLGIHKAGGAYLPLDPAYPKERIAYILSDAASPVIVTTSELARQLPSSEAKTILIDQIDWKSGAKRAASISPGLKPHHLAYVIYTSGSTGRPKGVAVEHRNAVNLVLWGQHMLDPEDLAGSLFSSSLNFDASVMQLFVPLTAGGRLVLVENLLRGPAAPGWDDVRFIDTVPSLIEELLKFGGMPKRIRTVSLLGEALTRALADRIVAASPGVRLLNTYGPTEITVYSHWSRVDPADRMPPAIGRPIWNTQFYILGPSLDLLPAGVPGELCIGGAGVARGYLNRPELTDEKFVPNPFGEGRLYRTGDTAILRADGEVDFLGRTDNQIKINGLRVELGEIEKQLEALPCVGVAVVIAKQDSTGTSRIHGYAIPAAANAKPDVAEILSQLQRTLPRHMIPSTLQWLNRFPLTPNGKLDRRALPEPGEPAKAPKREGGKPQNGTEAALLAIWREILKMPDIGIDDDFQDLGGTSFQAFLIFARIARDLGRDLPPTTIFEASTVEQLAAIVRRKVLMTDSTKVVTFRAQGSKPPLFLVHAAFGDISHGNELARHSKSDRPVFGIRPPLLDGSENIYRNIEDIAASYVAEIRAVRPKGPYCLGGYSAGGWIAFEMARILIEQGETIPFLGMIDTFAEHVRIPAKVELPPAFRRARPAPKRSFPKLIYRSLLRQAEEVAFRSIFFRIGAIRYLPPGIGKVLLPPPAYEEWRELYVRLFRGALQRYAPGVHDGRLVVFSGRGLTEYHEKTWGPLARLGVSVHEIPAHHSDIVWPPHSVMLAAALDSSLDRESP